jgi:hypothetical protein
MLHERDKSLRCRGAFRAAVLGEVLPRESTIDLKQGITSDPVLDGDEERKESKQEFEPEIAGAGFI